MSILNFKQHTTFNDTIYVYSADSDGTYTWYTSKRFKKEFLKRHQNIRHVIDSKDQKSFIDTEFHVKNGGTTYFYYDKTIEEVLSECKKKKGQIEIYKNHELIKVLNNS